MNSDNQQIKTNQVYSQIDEENLAFLKKEKSIFMGQLVHNLKNPIGSALSFSEMILDSADNYPTDKLKRHLNIIKSSCEAAITQLEMLLIESKIEANNLELYAQDTYFSDTFKNAFNDYQKLFSKNNLQCNILFPADEQKIKFDRNLIRHALSGIFQFVLTYTDSNSTVAIDISNQDNCLNFTIECNHCSDYENKIEELFNPNEQENQSIFNSKPEKYLALKNIEFIAKKHEGSLKIEKSPFKSLTVLFSISKEL